MPQIKAVIFDLDGTLLDSREFIYRAFEECLDSHGISVKREDIDRQIGKPIKTIYEQLAPNFDPDELEKAHLENHDQNLSLLSLFDGVQETLHELRGRGYKIGLFTGFNQLTYDRLDQFGIRNLFETIVESTRYTAHKPDPEGLYVAMADLGISSAGEVVYVGDGIVDMEAGKNAQAALTVGVSYGFGSTELLYEHGADKVVDSLSELLDLV